MNNKNENIDYWIGRAFMLCFFVFIVAFSKGSANSSTDQKPYSIEQLVDVDRSALIIESPNISNYNASLVEFELCNRKTQQTKLGVLHVSNKIDQQFKCEYIQFLKLKPKLLKDLSVYFKVSSNTDYPLIS